jgi:hypothetical protein
LGQDIWGVYVPGLGTAFGVFQMMPGTIYDLGGDYGLLDDPVYASQMAAKLQDIAGWGPWDCAY